MVTEVFLVVEEGHYLGHVGHSEESASHRLGRKRGCWLIHREARLVRARRLAKVRSWWVARQSVVPGSGIDISELERAAAQRRADDPVPAPFDSWFEVDVFLEISRKGYRVLPPYELAGYRIDLLVEGLKGRLAVECDGDVWHGLDRYDADMTRQRMLERCGLRFSRVRGSTFYRNPQSAMESLWTMLHRLGLAPQGLAS